MKRSLLCILWFTSLQCTAQKQISKIPISIIDNRAFVKTIIGTDTLQMVLDCGAVNAIDIDAAKKLNLPLTDPFPISGAGSQSQTAYRTRIEKLSIHDQLNYNNLSFLVVSFSTIKENLKLPFLDGTTGYTIFRDTIVRINYKEKYFQFLSAYESKSKGIDFELYRDQIPMIEVVVGNTKAKFIIDTGDRSLLTINKPFSEKMEFASKYQLSDSLVTGYGIGGAVYARRFTLPELTIAQHPYKNILTRIPTAVTGAFARSDVDGSIGAGFFIDKVLTIDYKNKKLYIE